ncbi:hypothetical protein JCM1841_003852 [Sporobolomyces salmonicolor]
MASFAPELASTAPPLTSSPPQPASTIASLIKNTKLGEVLRFIAHEWHLEAGKSSSFREKAAKSVTIMLGAEGVEMLIEKGALDRRIEDLEWIIKTRATDRESKVRAEMKKCGQVYQREWPERVYKSAAPVPLAPRWRLAEALLRVLEEVGMDSTMVTD